MGCFLDQQMKECQERLNEESSLKNTRNTKTNWRSLRQVVDLDELTGYTITIDCDVIQADGGTRTGLIIGGTIALCLALKKLVKNTL